jgi:hypothetical protein
LRDEFSWPSVMMTQMTLAAVGFGQVAQELAGMIDSHTDGVEQSGVAAGGVGVVGQR